MRLSDCRAEDGNGRTRQDQIIVSYIEEEDDVNFIEFPAEKVV